MPPGEPDYSSFKLLTANQVARQIGYNADTVNKRRGGSIVFGMGRARRKG